MYTYIHMCILYIYIYICKLHAPARYSAPGTSSSRPAEVSIPRLRPKRPS